MNLDVKELLKKHGALALFCGFLLWDNNTIKDRLSVVEGKLFLCYEELKVSELKQVEPPIRKTRKEYYAILATPVCIKKEEC